MENRTINVTLGKRICLRHYRILIKDVRIGLNKDENKKKNVAALPLMHANYNLWVYCCKVLFDKYALGRVIHITFYRLFCANNEVKCKHN